MEFFVANISSIQREDTAFWQREDQPAMETELERIAASLL